MSKQVLVPILHTRCSSEHNGGCYIGSCMGGSHVCQLLRQGVCQLSIGVQEGGGVLLLLVYNDNNDHNGMMTQMSGFTSHLWRHERHKKAFRQLAV